MLTESFKITDNNKSAPISEAGLREPFVQSGKRIKSPTHSDSAGGLNINQYYHIYFGENIIILPLRPVAKRG